MEKEWVFLHRCSAEYEVGLQAFISYTVKVAAIDGDIKCPCKECGNRHQLSPIVIEGHIQMFGMDDTYANGIWDKHVEKVPNIIDEILEVQNEDMQGLLADAFGMPNYGNEPDKTTSPTHGSTPYAAKFYQMVEKAQT